MFYRSGKATRMKMAQTTHLASFGPIVSSSFFSLSCLFYLLIFLDDLMGREGDKD